MSFGNTKKLSQVCEHKKRINKGSFNKLDIRCLRCNKPFREKMHLYQGMKKFEVRNIDDINKSFGESEIKNV